MAKKVKTKKKDKTKREIKILESKKEIKEIEGKKVKLNIPRDSFENFIQHNPQLRGKNSPVLNQIAVAPGPTVGNLEQGVAKSSSINKNTDENTLKYSTSNAKDNLPKYVESSHMNSPSQVDMQNIGRETTSTREVNMKNFSDSRNTNSEMPEKYYSPGKVDIENVGREPSHLKKSEVKYTPSKY